MAKARYAEAWKNLGRFMAPCLTPQNLCELTRQQLRALNSAMVARNTRAIFVPGLHLLQLEDGTVKSPTEMFEVVLGVLQDCNYALEPASLNQIVLRAANISQLTQVKLRDGQTWFIFQRKGLWIEDVAGVKDLTPQFRWMLGLSTHAALSFDQVWAKNIAGLIEIGGRVSEQRAGQRAGGSSDTLGFTMLITPLKDGTLPSRISLTVFR